MDAANLVGSTLAGCRIVASVARGSMGEVFRGQHLALQRPVAIKVVPLAGREQAAIDGLLLEARALAKIEHPNIVRVYDVGVQDGIFYIVMQFLEGETLKSRFDAVGALPEGELYAVMGGVARGLGTMHAQNLIHRDLKLENVIVTPEDQAVIMDFGLVRDPGAKDEYEGRIVGTLPYIAPEVWQGKPADARSDLYSLGVMFYALLCGTYPFRARSPKEYQELHLSTPARNPAAVNAQVDENLAAVAMKLLAKAPARRYATVEEFLRDLELCRRGDTPEALKSTGRKVKCGFCDSIMPAALPKCTVCGTALGSPKEIALQVRAGEIPCPSCGRLRERRSRVCPHCGKGICGNCLRKVVARDGLCADCLAIR